MTAKPPTVSNGLPSPIEAYADSLRVADRSQGYVTHMVGLLRGMQRHAGKSVDEMTAADVARFLSRPEIGAATRARYASIIGSFFRWYARNGGCDVAAELRLASRKGTPPAWESAIEHYLKTIAAVGQRPATIQLRRGQLKQMARGLGCPPDEVTGEVLVNWFGDNLQWTPETRKNNRAMAKGFFTWAYRTGRMPVYIGDEILRVRVPKAAPRPAPDDVWEAALAAADARATLMLRLAGEVGLRRGEVAQVHTRDVLVAGGTAQLLVRGKGGKERIVPSATRLPPCFVAAPVATRPVRRRRASCFPAARTATCRRTTWGF